MEQKQSERYFALITPLRLVMISSECKEKQIWTEKTLIRRGPFSMEGCFFAFYSHIWCYIWVTVCPPRSTKVHQGPPRTTQVNSGPSWITMNHPCPPRSTWDQPGSPWITQVHLGQPRSTKVQLNPPRVTLDHPGPSRFIQVYLGPLRSSQVH